MPYHYITRARATPLHPFVHVCRRFCATLRTPITVHVLHLPISFVSAVFSCIALQITYQEEEEEEEKEEYPIHCLSHKPRTTQWGAFHDEMYAPEGMHAKKKKKSTFFFCFFFLVTKVVKGLRKVLLVASAVTLSVLDERREERGEARFFW